MHRSVREPLWQPSSLTFFAHSRCVFPRLCKLLLRRAQRFRSSPCRRATGAQSLSPPPFINTCTATTSPRETFARSAASSLALLVEYHPRKAPTRGCTHWYCYYRVRISLLSLENGLCTIASHFPSLIGFCHSLCGSSCSKWVSNLNMYCFWRETGQCTSAWRSKGQVGGTTTDSGWPKSIATLNVILRSRI